jgi:hypothetical protein
MIDEQKLKEYLKKHLRIEVCVNYSGVAVKLLLDDQVIDQDSGYFPSNMLR